jgi:hypothetical protein
MSFPRNTDVSKHLARKIYRSTPKPASERLATSDELASVVIPIKSEAIVLTVSTKVRRILSDGSVG